jgi:hypothetical protein
MNLIIQNSNNIVLIQTTGEIAEANGNYCINGINSGISIEGNSVIFNANPCTYQEFYEQTYTYIDGVWGIGNQEFYDGFYGNLCLKTGDEVKVKRDALLYASDWTQIPNNPLTAEQQQLWVVYRQELRDVTTQSGYPFNVVWPTAPIKASSTQPESSGLQQL